MSAAPDRPGNPAVPEDPSAAGRSSVYGLICDQARRHPDRLALEFNDERFTYAELVARADAIASWLRARGITRGERIGVLAENRPEYTVLQIAAARIGAIVACLNWRMAPAELEHCVALVAPKLLVTSARYADLSAALGASSGEHIELEVLARESVERLPDTVSPERDPESGLLILYTSGTTGRPKAALISQRALIARMSVLRMDLGITPEDAYIAWSPMFHMGGTEHTLSTLMFGGTVTILGGFEPARIAEVLARRRIGWLLLVPATIDPLLDELDRSGAPVQGVKVVGCMADLVPAESIAAISARVAAPFFNSFGATETGLGPASAGLLAPGVAPTSLAKTQSSLYELRIVNAGGEETGVGQPGEALVRGATLFSGYFNDPDATARDFRGGWFHMGDLLARNADGTLEYVGRAKYLIKSGGENIYPAEIERVLLADERVADVAVVRKPDPRWGEVPVAFVAARDGSLTAEDIETLCRSQLAAYKRPREVRFVSADELPRSATGKIQREVLERWLTEATSKE